MKARPMNPRFLVALALLSNSLLANAEACTVCMGDANSNIAGAANAAIFVMLGAIGLMLAATGGVAFYIYRHAQAPIPPHIQLVESMSTEA